MQYETHVASENFEYQLWHKGRLEGVGALLPIFKKQVQSPNYLCFVTSWVIPCDHDAGIMLEIYLFVCYKIIEEGGKQFLHIGGAMTGA